MQQKRSELVPYANVNGVWTIPPQILIRAYEKMVERDLVRVVFPTIQKMDALDFVAMMQASQNIPVFVLDGEDCLGFAWLNGVGFNHAYGHFCFFIPDPVELGRRILNYWFGMAATLNVIVGTVPEYNAAAIGFVRKLGFKHVGSIPNLYPDLEGGTCASVIHYLERGRG